MASEGDEVTTNLTFGPPKYQTVLPSSARKILDCEDEKIYTEAKIVVKKVEDTDS